MLKFGRIHKFYMTARRNYSMIRSESEDKDIEIDRGKIISTVVD